MTEQKPAPKPQPKPTTPPPPKPAPKPVSDGAKYLNGWGSVRKKTE